MMMMMMMIWKPALPTHNQEAGSNQPEKCMLSNPKERYQVGVGGSLIKNEVILCIWVDQAVTAVFSFLDF